MGFMFMHEKASLGLDKVEEEEEEEEAAAAAAAAAVVAAAASLGLDGDVALLNNEHFNET